MRTCLIIAYPKKWEPILLDVLVVIGLVSAGVRYTYGINHFADISMADETSYLAHGLSWAGLQNLGPEWSPLYSLWYHVLSYVSSDRVDLFFINQVVLTCILPVLAYLICRRYRIGTLSALAISLFVLVSHSNYLILPKVTLFGLGILLSTLYLASWIDSSCGPTGAYSVILAGTIALVYIRPEYTLFAGIIFCLLLVSVLRSIRVGVLRPLVLLSLPVLVFLALILCWGMPFTGDSRSLIAFGQHFALNWVAWNHSALSPWTDWEQIILRAFGHVESVTETVMANPSLWLRHISSNVLALPVSFVYRLFGHEALIFPSALWKIETILVGTTIISYAVWRSLSTPKQVEKHLREASIPLLVLSLYVIVALVPCILIYPRDHYLAPIAIATWLIGALLWANRPTKRPAFRDTILELLIVIAVVPQVITSLSLWGVKQDDLNIVKQIQSLSITQPVVLLEAAGGYDVYLGDNFRGIAQYSKQTSFAGFLRDEGINLIVVSPDLMSDSRFVRDKSWIDFLAQVEQNGWRRIEVPLSNTSLLISPDLQGIPQRE